MAALEAMLQAGLGGSVLSEGWGMSRLGQGLVTRRLPGDGEPVALLWPATPRRGRRLEAVLEALR